MFQTVIQLGYMRVAIYIREHIFQQKKVKIIPDLKSLYLYQVKSASSFFNKLYMRNYEDC